MKSTKMYCRNKLSQMMDQNEDEVNELMKIFIQMVPIMLNEMLSYVNDKNWPECGNIAHKLKSSMRLWDINELDEDVVYIETYGLTSENTTIITEKVQNLNSQLLKIIHEMKSEIEIS